VILARGNPVCFMILLKGLKRVGMMLFSSPLNGLMPEVLELYALSLVWIMKLSKYF
jgi:hypothetical protein